MKTSQVSIALQKAIAYAMPILLVGSPGVGKTQLGEQAARAMDADLIVSHPVVEDQTDVKGLPWPAANKEYATFLPYGHLARALRATRPTVWLLDDLGQAAPSVQAAYMQLLLARRVNEHALPDCVTFIAATNRRSDRAAVSGILEPVKSRFVSIIEVEPDLDDWCDWAAGAGVPPEVISFLRIRGKLKKNQPGQEDQPDLFNNFSPTAEMTNSPCPRTWHHVGQILKADFPEEMQREMFEGAVGKAAAAEFHGHIKFYRELASPEAILLDPDRVRLPTDLSALYAMCSALAYRVNLQNFHAIVRVAKRLYESGVGEFSALLIRDCYRKEPKVQNTTEWAGLVTSATAKLWVG